MSLLRFGIFEFDPDTRQLRRDGVAVHLQAQPAQVLAFLLSRASEVVSRESLRQEVWKDGTFVDFDRGLNFCIAQIRSVLGDSAESPRFIRTLPKRGYQFIAPVSTDGAPPQPVPAPPKAAFSKRTLAAFGLVAVLILAALIAGRWSARRQLASPEQYTVAVARFDNETGTAEMTGFADGLTDSLVAELTASGSGRFSVIGNAAILRLPRSQRDLTAIGGSLKADYIVLGQVQRNGSQIRVLAHLIGLPGQKHLRVSRSDFDLADPLRQQTELAHRISTELSATLEAKRASQGSSPALVRN